MTGLLAVDIGGTKIRAGVVAADRTVTATRQVSTPGQAGAAAVLDAVAAVVAGLRADPDTGALAATACGVASAGVVDHRTGTVVSATDVITGWAGTAVAAELAGRLALPVAVDNDVNAFALGEAVAGAAAGRHSCLAVTVGTGIGAGLVHAGWLWHGAHQAAGEIGHLPVPGAGDRACPCGGRGHLESLASGPAMSLSYAERTGSAVRPLPEVVALAQSGDVVAAEVLAAGAGLLGRMLAGLVNSIDPELVVVGGGVLGAGPAYWSALRAAFAGDLLPATRRTELVRATLEDDAVLIGAAELVRPEFTEAR